MAEISLRIASTVVVAAIVGMLASGSALAAEGGPPSSPLSIAQAEGTEGRELEPRYKSAPVEVEEGGYNSDYIFGMTRSVAGSTIHTAGKAPLFLLSVPLDLVILPFAAIGGLFG